MNQFDGAVKYLTADCATCPFFVQEPLSRRVLSRYQLPKKYRPPWDAKIEWCIWGVAIKRLVERDRVARSCALRSRTAQGAERWIAMLAVPLPEVQASLPYDHSV
jgi:hypothetical protein